jgi:hypothetical protein
MRKEEFFQPRDWEQSVEYFCYTNRGNEEYRLSLEVRAEQLVDAMRGARVNKFHWLK